MCVCVCGRGEVERESRERERERQKERDELEKGVALNREAHTPYLAARIIKRTYGAP